MKVLVFGSLNIDYNYKVDHFVQKGETLLSDNLSVFSGGKGLNQSIALARAGAEVYQAGCIGEDGLFLLDLLRRSKVNTDYINIRNDIRTGNAIIQIDKEGDNCILLFGGANQAQSKEYIDSVFCHFEQNDFLVLQNEINEMAYIMAKAKEIGMTIVLNPSPMNEKIETYPLNKVDYFILNEVEAMQILNALDAAFDEEQILDNLQRKFPESKIVLTVGSRGSFYRDETFRIKQESYKVKAVDTTAAGDTYTGYFISCLIRGMTVNEAMDVASRASALAVTKQGAAQSIPAYEEVIQWSTASSSDMI